MRRRIWTWVLVSVVMGSGIAVAQHGGKSESTAVTPPSLVSAYSSLADTLLAARTTERNLVHAILATTYGHAQASYAAAGAKLKAGQDARSEIEGLASLVAQLGNEGDASVAAVRKRLVDQGHHHHHHADDQSKDEYDEGFVLVTKAAKKIFIDASKEIGKLAASPNAAALDSQWQKVTAQFEASCEGAKH